MRGGLREGVVGTIVIVALDSSTDVAGVALLRDGLPIADYSWRAAGRHTAQLLPALDMLCHDTGSPPDSWSAVAVAIGPGSFNGIRSGMALAMGLAMSRSVPLVGIGGLDALAYAAYLERGGGAPIVTLLPAGRSELYCATYRPPSSAQSGLWSAAARLAEPALTSLPDLLTALHALAQGSGGPITIGGVLPPDAAASLSAALGDRVVLPLDGGLPRRAAALGLLAWQYLQAGGEDQLLTVAPLYLRRVTVTQSRRPLASTVAEGV